MSNRIALMAAYKNQHFVPRAHLKPFTLNGEGYSICLYNERARKFIVGAPVKDQCSRDYFYGRDRLVEGKLGELEGAYRKLVEEITYANHKVEPIQMAWLRLFWAVQWARTEAAADAAKAIFTSAANLLDRPRLAEGPSKGGWIDIPMSTFHQAHQHSLDLSCVFVRNETSIPFITSDNPAVVSNKYHLLDRRVRSSTFGIASGGALLFLPLSPTVTSIFYDSDVYRVDVRGDWVAVKSERDVLAINEHQIIGCNANVYYSSHWPHEWIHDEFRRLAGQRNLERWISKPNPHEDGGGIVFQEIHRRPNRWPSFLRWKARGRVYESGTGEGVVREMHVYSNPLRRFKPIIINK